MVQRCNPHPPYMPTPPPVVVWWVLPSPRLPAVASASERLAIYNDYAYTLDMLLVICDEK